MAVFSRETKERGAHFTPRDIALYIAEGLYGMMDNPPANVSVLDPSCGDGELLLAMYEVMASASLVSTMIRLHYHLPSKESGR